MVFFLVWHDNSSWLGISPAFSNCRSFFALSFAQLSLCVRACVRVYWREAIFPVAVAPAELAALMHHGIILDRCCYLCSVSKPIILTQIYVNTAVSWHRMKFTQAQEGSWKHYSVWLFFSVHSTQNVFWEPKNGLWVGQTGKGNRAKQNSNFSFKVTKIKTKNHTKKTVNLYQTFY